MSKVVVEKGPHRVTIVGSTSRANGAPLGYNVETRRKGRWKQVAFKAQRQDALELFGERAGVRV